MDIHSQQLLAESARNVSNRTQRICALSNRSSMKSVDPDHGTDQGTDSVNTSNSPRVRMVDIHSNPYQNLLPTLSNKGDSNPFLSVPDPPSSPLLSIQEESRHIPWNGDGVEHGVAHDAHLRKSNLIHVKSERLMEEKYRKQQESGTFLKSMFDCLDADSWRSCFEQMVEPIANKLNYGD